MAFACPYRFTEGKHEGGCGHGNAPKGTDTKGGCDRLGTGCPLNQVTVLDLVLDDMGVV